jgi:hypothetical protein
MLVFVAMIAGSILAELTVAGLTVASCAVAVAVAFAVAFIVAVMDSMVARVRFLRYPNLAGNSEFRRLGGRERAEKGKLFCGRNCPF